MKPEEAIDILKDLHMKTQFMDKTVGEFENTLAALQMSIHAIESQIGSTHGIKYYLCPKCGLKPIRSGEYVVGFDMAAPNTCDITVNEVHEAVNINENY